MGDLSAGKWNGFIRLKGRLSRERERKLGHILKRVLIMKKVVVLQGPLSYNNTFFCF